MSINRRHRNWRRLFNDVITTGRRGRRLKDKITAATSCIAE